MAYKTFPKIINVLVSMFFPPLEKTVHHFFSCFYRRALSNKMFAFTNITTKFGYFFSAWSTPIFLFTCDAIFIITFCLVKSHMFGISHNFKIRYSIISFYMIFVMNVLIFSKFYIKTFFINISMPENSFTINSDDIIPTRINLFDMFLHNSSIANYIY